MGVHAGSRSRESRSDRPRRTKAGEGAGPLVSVVVPAWNAERTLLETLQSAAAQTYRNIEIIIVDDGSTDSTADVAEQFCKGESRARLVRTENGGVASARNRGISEAAGEWIAPIDADDLWHPTRIEKMLAAALAAPEMPGFVYSWSRHVDGDGRITGSGPRWAVQGKGFRQAAYLNVVGNGSGLLASRAAIGDVGGYDSTLRAERAQGAEDLLAQIRIARRYGIAVVPEYLIGWRNAGDSMSSDVEQMDRSCRLVYRRLAEDGTPVPAAVERRMLASSALDVAEHYAATGKLMRAIGWLFRSLRLDPLRSGLTVAYRVARSARRKLGPAVSIPQLENFHDADPTVCIHPDPYRLDRLADWLRLFDLHRLKRLAQADSAGPPKEAGQATARAATITG